MMQENVRQAGRDHPALRRYYEGATTSHSRIPGHLFVSLPGTAQFLLVSCSPLPALPGEEAPPRARILVRPAIHFAGVLSRGREWELSDCMSLSTNEATHPRCNVEGCPDRPGRASYMEGES
jgi:hypothetical protein